MRRSPGKRHGWAWLTALPPKFKVLVVTFPVCGLGPRMVPGLRAFPGLSKTSRGQQDPSTQQKRRKPLLLSS